MSALRRSIAVFLRRRHLITNLAVTGDFPGVICCGGVSYKVGRTGTCNFPADSYNFSTGDIMAALKFNFAPKIIPKW